MKLNVAILVAFVLNTTLTFSSSLLPGAQSNAVLSAKYQSLATPAGWAFSIWGIIFTLEAIFSVAQLLPSFRDTDEVQKAGPLFAAGCVLQAVWSLVFAYEYVGCASVVLLLIALALWRTVAVLAQIASEKPPTAGRYVLLYLPFSIHFGWLTAATALGVNVAVVAAAPEAHAALLAVAVLSLALVFVMSLLEPSGSADSAYDLALAWALIGIAAQLRAPLIGAPAASPILSWCPSFVTAALAIVALALGAGAAAVAVVSAVVGRNAALRSVAQPLIAEDK